MPTRQQIKHFKLRHAEKLLVKTQKQANSTDQHVKERLKAYADSKSDAQQTCFPFVGNLSDPIDCTYSHQSISDAFTELQKLELSNFQDGE